jgi:hypothetical protein
MIVFKGDESKTKKTQESGECPFLTRKKKSSKTCQDCIFIDKDCNFMNKLIGRNSKSAEYIIACSKKRI